MKIKTKPFRAFLKKARMSGSEAIEEVLLKFDEIGLNLGANSKTQLARVEAELITEAFSEYEAIGNVGISKFGVFVEALRRFKETITISKNGNLLNLKEDKKQVDIELVADAYIGDDKQPNPIEYEESFELPAGDLNDIYKDAALNEDAVLHITTEDKKVIFKNTGAFKFTTEIDAPNCVGGVSAKFGAAIVNATKELTGTLKVQVKSNFPVTITETEPQSTIKIFVAPRVTKEKSEA